MDDPNIAVAANPAYPLYEEELPQNREHLENSYLTKLIRPLWKNKINPVNLVPKFNWVQSSKYGVMVNCPVPAAINQGRTGTCIVMATKTLLQFQVNLVAQLNQRVAPKLSLKHMLWGFKKLQFETTPHYLRWIRENGILTEEYFDKDSPNAEAVEGVTRIYIDWEYGFDTRDDEFDLTLKTAILAYGGVLCELIETTDFHLHQLHRPREAYEVTKLPEENVYGMCESHLVSLFGWDRNQKLGRDEYLFLNSHGSNVGFKVASKGGYGKTATSSIQNIFVPQIKKWWGLDAKPLKTYKRRRKG